MISDRFPSESGRILQNPIGYDNRIGGPGQVICYYNQSFQSKMDLYYYHRMSMYEMIHMNIAIEKIFLFQRSFDNIMGYLFPYFALLMIIDKQ